MNNNQKTIINALIETNQSNEKTVDILTTFLGRDELTEKQVKVLIKTIEFMFQSKPSQTEDDPFGLPVDVSSRIEKLKTYSGSNAFLLNLRSQLLERGTLSEKQKQSLSRSRELN